MNILLASPFLDLCKPAIRLLNKEGHEVTYVPGGAEALMALREKEYDLLICNVLMHSPDGIEVMQQLRADAKLSYLPIILMEMMSSVQEHSQIVRSYSTAYGPQYGPTWGIKIPIDLGVLRYEIRRLEGGIPPKEAA